jgi:NAD(P)-dependent dehydrogenase (short-subunit alcohol dehydrogenase family)
MPPRILSPTPSSLPSCTTRTFNPPTSQPNHLTTTTTTTTTNNNKNNHLQHQHQHQHQQIRTLKIYASSKHSLRKSTCLITGASRGIGRAIALAFAREGARCILLGRNRTSLLETHALCTSARGSLGRPHSIITGDVTDHLFWADIEKHQDAFAFENGKLDVLVNAAGVTHSSLLLRTTQKKVEEILHTNLAAAIQASRFATRKFLKNMTEEKMPTARRGHIINISSLLATHGGVGSVAYAASKAGLLGLTRSLAAEMGPRGIRVNAICPGYVESDMVKDLPEKVREAAIERIPAGRFGSVDEVADAAVFLCGNQYANNCVLNLDGGLSAV